jgi:DNA polymerase (family 10)
MDNYFIAEQFSMLAKLMDIHGENSFKSKSYSIAAFNIEKLPIQLSEVSPDKMFSLKGIGESTGKKILEIIQNGKLSALENIILKTPPGILEMLRIKGLGPKKISVIWKEMEIESPGELLYACNENRLSRFKGFGDKTQESIREAISFYFQNQGSHLFAQIEAYAYELDKIFKKAFSGERFELTGELRMHALVVNKLEWITSVPVHTLQAFFKENKYTEEEILTGTSMFRTPENVLIVFHSRADEVFWSTVFETSSSTEFLNEWNKSFPKNSSIHSSEEEIFKARNLNYIPPYLREQSYIVEEAKNKSYEDLIQPSDIKAIIHSHSEWSDGSNTIEQMALACIQKGLKYMVISDHSKSAAYANGLSEERIKSQHQQIDELNNKLDPFRIFKSIESDILGDGSLDYSDAILSTFDLVIASVHSNIKMTEEKAMSRLLKAISNPYTTILGHMTARLLLSRPGYPVNHEIIIDACAKHKVVIEINANPRRLDMDWKWINYAINKGVLLSIDPDAHDISEFDNCRFGVLAGQKGGMRKENNLSSMTIGEFEQLLANKKRGRT